MHPTELRCILLWAMLQHTTELRCTLWSTLDPNWATYLSTIFEMSEHRTGILSVRYLNEKECRCRKKSDTGIKRPSLVPKCCGSGINRCQIQNVTCQLYFFLRYFLARNNGFFPQTYQLPCTFLYFPAWDKVLSPQIIKKNLWISSNLSTMHFCTFQPEGLQKVHVSVWRSPDLERIELRFGAYKRLLSKEIGESTVYTIGL